MSEEEKTLKYLSAMRVIEFDKLGFVYGKETITEILNLIQSQQKEIEKLRNKNKDLLRKLRNRVKEVKKLTKYSLYKKEFSKLNKEIEKNKEFIDYLQNRNIKCLDTIIYMANFINDNTPYTKDTKVLENEEGIRTATFTVQYFEKKVEDKQC